MTPSTFALTPAYPELVAATRREGSALLSAGRLGLDVAVPSCPGWDVRRLLLHVGRVYHYAAHTLDSRADAAPERRPRPPADVDPVTYCEDALEELVQALGGADPQTPVWNWSPLPDTAAFWARRMAHESAVHRWDAQHAHGYQQRIEPQLAVDGIAELLEVMLPRALGNPGAKADVPAPDGVLEVDCVDVGERLAVRIGPRTAEPAVGESPDTTVSGHAADLLLVLYGRLPLAAVEVTGDLALLDTWTASVRL